MKIKVTIRVNTSYLPDHTDEQLEEWLEYSIAARAHISADNPLRMHDLDNTDLLEWDEN